MTYTWWIRFDDEKRLCVQDVDIQDAIRLAHKSGGEEYTYRNMVEARRV